MSWIDKYEGKLNRNGRTGLRPLAETKAVAEAIGAKKNGISWKALEWKDAIEALREGLMDVACQIKELGNLVVALEDKQEDAFERILVEIPFLTRAKLQTLESIGHGRTDPRVILLGGGVLGTKLAGMPMQAQSEILDKSIPVAVKTDGGIMAVNKTVHQLTERDARVAIGDKGIRTMEEQTEIIAEDEKRKATRALTFLIQDGKVKFFHDAEFTFAQLEEILERGKVSGVRDLEATMKQGQVKR